MIIFEVHIAGPIRYSQRFGKRKRQFAAQVSFEQKKIHGCLGGYVCQVEWDLFSFMFFMCHVLSFEKFWGVTVVIQWLAYRAWYNLAVAPSQ